MRYLLGTSSLKLMFGSWKSMLVDYIDLDVAGYLDNKKSPSDYLMTFTSGTMSWQSRLQKCFAFSTVEAEYIVAARCVKRCYGWGGLYR